MAFFKFLKSVLVGFLLLAREPQLLSSRATTTEARAPRSHAPQEKPPQ